jgi:molybdopterin-guanine dinucleotide biosynthesis protein A
MAAIVGLILAGGRGSRMGNADKGLVALQERPMVAHVAERLAPQTSRLVISANRHTDAYASYGTVVGDDPALGGWQGPLAGVLAGMTACAPDEPWLVTVPCDTPFIPHDLVARLLAGAQASDTRTSMHAG